MKRLLSRILRSIRNRSLKHNCSTWYLTATNQYSNQKQEIKSPDEFRFKVLEGDEKKYFHQWLKKHHKRYPWIYFPDEIKSSEKYQHWNPALFKGDEMISWVKLGRRSVYIHDFESSVTLPENVAFIYDTFVHPDYRQQGLASHLLENIKQFLADKDYAFVVCHIEDWNRPSVLTFTRNGFKPVGKVCYRRITFFRYLKIDGAFSKLSHLPDWLKNKVL